MKAELTIEQSRSGQSLAWLVFLVCLCGVFLFSLCPRKNSRVYVGDCEFDDIQIGMKSDEVIRQVGKIPNRRTYGNPDGGFSYRWWGWEGVVIATFSEDGRVRCKSYVKPDFVELWLFRLQHGNLRRDLPKETFEVSD